MAEPRNCPQCGTPMAFRLGEYNCSQCGLSEALAAPAPKASASGPGFQQPWQSASNTGGRPGGGTQHWQPGRFGSPGVPPPPPPGTLYQPGQRFQVENSYGGVYERAESPPQGSLLIEKHIYFALQAVGTFVLIVLVIAMGPTMAQVDPSMSGGMSFGAVIGGIIGLGIIWFVLYGTEIWAKWCCGGCTGVSILGLIPAMFMSPTATGDFSNGPFAFLQLLFSLWFLSILWRDIQRLKG